jgi:hypothetical protein
MESPSLMLGDSACLLAESPQLFLLRTKYERKEEKIADTPASVEPTKLLCLKANVTTRIVMYCH